MLLGYLAVLLVTPMPPLLGGAACTHLFEA